MLQIKVIKNKRPSWKPTEENRPPLLQKKGRKSFLHKIFKLALKTICEKNDLFLSFIHHLQRAKGRL
jgi:hypothetical protein